MYENIKTSNSCKGLYNGLQVLQIVNVYRSSVIYRTLFKVVNHLHGLDFGIHVDWGGAVVGVTAVRGI